MIFLEKPGFVKINEFKKINILLDKMKNLSCLDIFIVTMIT